MFPAFDPKLALHKSGRFLMACGPLNGWEDNEVSAIITEVTIRQVQNEAGDVLDPGVAGDTGVAVVAREGGEVGKFFHHPPAPPDDEWEATARVRGNRELAPGPAQASGRVRIEKTRGYDEFEWPRPPDPPQLVRLVRCPPKEE